MKLPITAAGLTLDSMPMVIPVTRVCHSFAVAVVPIHSSYRLVVWIGSILLLLIFLAVISLRYPAAAKQTALWIWEHKLILFLIVLTAAGATWIYRGDESHSATAPSDLLTDQEWPLDRGGLCRRGVAANSSGPTVGVVQWAYNRRSEAFYSSPAVVGRFVFAVGSRDDQGRIYCFDQRSGDVVWSCAPPDYLATFSSPVIAGKFLYCGEGLHHARQARVVCIDLRPGRAGQLVWTFRTNNHVECSPVVDQGRVYFGAGDDGIYCLDGANVVAGSPQVVFHAPGDKYPDVETSLVVYEGRVYAGLGIGGEAICVLDARTGAELKRLRMPYPVFGPPSIDRGKLYVGLGDGNFVNPNKTRMGQVCCLDLATLEIDWTYDIRGTVMGAVAVVDDRLVFGASDGYVYLLTTGGQLVAKADCRAAVACSPAVTEAFVFVVNESGTMFWLDRNSLNIQSEMTLGRGGRFTSSPVVADDRVFVGTENHGFLGVGSAKNPLPEGTLPR